MADADLLFKWANDAAVRAWSRSTSTISRADHDRWMAFNVLTGYPTHWVMIADTDFGSVGVVRLDMFKNDVMKYRVSITVGSDYRGKGYGYAILDRACHIMSDSLLIAEIKSSNAASRRIFERCGFEEQDRHAADSTPDTVTYHREPQ